MNLEDRSLYTSDSDLIATQRLLTHSFFLKFKYHRECYPYFHGSNHTKSMHTHAQYAQYTHWFSLMHTFTSHIHLHTHICTHTHHRHILYPCLVGNELMKVYQENFNLCNLFKSIFSILSATQKFLALWYQLLWIVVFWTLFLWPLFFSEHKFLWYHIIM